MIFIFTWCLPPEDYLPLVLSRQNKIGSSYLLDKINLHLSDSLSDLKNVYFIDHALIQARFEGKLHDPRLYAIGRIRYSIEYQNYVADNIYPLLKSSIVQSKKLIICDLDNTLWSGIVGDEGIDNIKIGDNDPFGEVYLEFQKYLRALYNRGIILAVSSKNNHDIALEPFRIKREMILNLDDINMMRFSNGGAVGNAVSDSASNGQGVGEVNITINMEKGDASVEQNSNGDADPTQTKEFAKRIKDVVVGVINEEKRVSGSLFTRRK